MSKSDDLISRQDAIEAIEEIAWYHQNRNREMVSGANSTEDQAWYKSQDIYAALEALPSAEAVHKPDYSYEAGMVRRLKEALSAEVVEVVRCGECKNRGSDACPMFFEEWFTIDEGDGYVDDDYRIHDHTESDGYCHWGERKGGDEE